MENKLIKQLNNLKSIKLSYNSKEKIRERILMEYKETATFNKLFNFDWLFRPVPRIVFVAVVMLIVASASFGIFISNENFFGEPARRLVGTNNNNKEMELGNEENNKEIELGNKETNKEIGKNREIQQVALPINTINTNDTKNNDKNNKEKEVSPYVSAVDVDNRELSIDDFKIGLMERINRVWVLAFEAGNKESFSVAVEAEKLFGNGDIDSALRAVMVAEELLKE